MSASAKSSCVDIHWFTQRIHHARVDTLANVLPPIPLHGRVLQDIRSEGSTVTSKLHELADNPHGVVKGARVPPLETCTATGWRQILALPTSDDEQWRSAARTEPAE
jgi:hypothetical protein